MTCECTQNIPWWVLVIGYLSVFNSLVYRIPQIIKIIKMRRTDISIGSQIVNMLSYPGYVFYAAYIGDYVNLISSVISLLQSLLLIALALRMSKPETNTASLESATWTPERSGSTA